MDIKQIIKFGTLLMFVCAIAAGALAFTYAKTKPVIELRRQEEEQEAIKSVFPEAARIEIIEKDKERYTLVYDKDKKELGVVLKITPVGYSGIIETLVGVTREGKISAIKILTQNETPGLGAKVAEPKFYKQFGKKSEKEVLLKKDGGTVDAVTAATISSRAVSRGVQDAVQKAAAFYQEHK